MRIKQLAKLFQKHQKHLYYCALVITKNRESAEDAVHDALIAVAQTNGDIKDLKSYMFSAVRNKAVYSCVKNNKFRASIEDIVVLEEDTTQQQVFASQIFTHLDNLTQEQQQTIVMKIFGGLTFKEIAQVTNNPVNTVASWAIHRLCEYLFNHSPALNLMLKE